MNKSFVVFIPLVLLSASALWSGSVDYLFTMNTSSVVGTIGSLDFALNPGAGSDQSLSASIFGFVTDIGSYAGAQTLTGNAIGGPVTAGATLFLLANKTTADNDDLETFKFGKTLSFEVQLSGPALTAPDGFATSPYEFIFSTYSDEAGTIPVLTNDPGGAAGTINISPEGAIKTSNVSSKLGIVASSPEPQTLWMLSCALTFFGGMRYARRRPVLQWLSYKPKRRP